MVGPSIRYVATEDAVKARLRSLGCDIVENGTTTSFFVRIRLCDNNDNENKETHCHVPVPRAQGGIGYTQRQLNKIEKTLAYFGIELLPLDYSLVYLN